MNNSTTELEHLDTPLTPEASDANPAMAEKVIAEATESLLEAVNPNLLKAAYKLVRRGMTDPEVIKDTLRHAGHREATERELNDVVRKALNRDTSALLIPAWPNFNRDFLTSLVKACECKTLDDLTEKYGVLHEKTRDVLTRLYRLDDLLCFGASFNKNVNTAPLKKWLKLSLDKLPLIVPNPMSARTGKVKDNVGDGYHDAPRCNDNTGPRIYHVIEFDDYLKNGKRIKFTEAEQVAAHEHLAQFRPIVMHIWSGNKSLHGWYDATGYTEVENRELHAKARELGADLSSFTPCQFVRTPGATRNNGQLQRIVTLRSPSDVIKNAEAIRESIHAATAKTFTRPT